MAPSLLFGTLTSPGAANNLTWATQFADQFRAGNPYPRWMADSFGGLGSPAFYFYPPLAFWIDALVSVVSFNAMPVPYRLAVSATLILWASGLAMRAWLNYLKIGPRPALLGALAYMVAPYHLLDHYMRGAYSELAAFAVLPVVMLAVGYVADRRRGGAALLAVTYAGLITAHLPTALLSSFTVIPVYVLYRERRPDALARCAVGGGLGIALAMIYLAPTLLMQGTVSIQVFWNGLYQVSRWFVLTPDRWPESQIMWAITGLCVGYAVLGVGICVAFRRRPEPLFWAATSVGCVALVAGVVPWFWSVPEIAKVQFPWRLMVVVEFCAVTALTLVPWKNLPRLAVTAFAVAALALGAVGVLILRDLGPRIADARAQTPIRLQDAKEFLPRGYALDPSRSHTQLGLEPLADIPEITCAPVASVCRVVREAFGALRIEIDSEEPTRVFLRRFTFPVWRLEPHLPLASTEQLRLIAFDAPVGRRTFRLERGSVWPERLGWSISGQTFLLLLVWGLSVRWGVKADQRMQ